MKNPVNLIKLIKLSVIKIISKLRLMRLRFLLSRISLRVLGYTSAHRFGVKIGWVLLADKSIFKYASKIIFVEKKSSDISLITRIIESYNKNIENTPSPVSDLWNYNFVDRWTSLRSALIRQDTEKVEMLLATMFRQNFTHGITYGGHINMFPHFRIVVGVSILTHLVELGEYLGITRVETQEQGVAAYELLNGYKSLLEKIENRIGISLDFPPFGSPWGIPTKAGLLLHGQIPHVYNALRISELIGDKRVDIVEIGGGYGGLCYWVHKILGNRLKSYVIIDLPEVQVLQAYFLSQSLGDISYDPNNGKIRLVKNTELRNVEKCDLVVNQDSFPEMGKAAVDIYLDWVEKNSAQLWSMNQEAYSPFKTEEQVWISREISKRNVFKRRIRERSWVREGYVEELYDIII